MVQLRTSQTGGFYYVKTRKYKAVVDGRRVRGEKAKPRDSLYFRFYRLLCGFEYVFRIQTGGNTIFLYAVFIHADGDYHWADLWLCCLLFRGLGRLFIPFGRVYVYAVGRAFAWAKLYYFRVHRPWNP